jgi:hypothetical protein
VRLPPRIDLLDPPLPLLLVLALLQQLEAARKPRWTLPSRPERPGEANPRLCVYVGICVLCLCVVLFMSLLE